MRSAEPVRFLVSFAILFAGCDVKPRHRPVAFLSEDTTGGERPAPAREPPHLVRRVYTYKTAGTLELQADVFRLSNFAVGPILVFIHGGALLGGDRGIVPEQLQPLARAGWVIVSIDHRLAPETKLGAIVEDVKDAMAWAHGEGARVFQGDPERIAVLGVSSGAYLAQIAGYAADPPPKAIVSMWGYSDLLADFWLQPDERALRRTHLTREDAFRDVLDHEIAKRPANAARLNLFCRQQGQFPQIVTGLDPATQAEAFDPFRPIRHVTSSYPPVLLVHGQDDREVPFQQSALMAAELGRKSVPFELLLVPGAGHGLDGAPPAEVTRVWDRARGFLVRHLAPQEE